MEKIKIKLSVPDESKFEMVVEVGNQKEVLVLTEEIMNSNDPDLFFGTMAKKIEDLLEKELENVCK